MLEGRQVMRGLAMLLPAVILAVGLSAPVAEVDAFPVSPSNFTPKEGAVLIFLLPFAIVLGCIAAFAVTLWRRARKPLPPHQELIAMLTTDEWPHR